MCIECTFHNLGGAYINTHLRTHTCDQMLAVTPCITAQGKNGKQFERKSFAVIQGLSFNDKTKDTYREQFNISKKIDMKGRNPLL